MRDSVQIRGIHRIPCYIISAVVVDMINHMMLTVDRARNMGIKMYK